MKRKCLIEIPNKYVVGRRMAPKRFEQALYLARQGYNSTEIVKTGVCGKPLALRAVKQAKEERRAKESRE